MTTKCHNDVTNEFLNVGVLLLELRSTCARLRLLPFQYVSITSACAVGCVVASLSLTQVLACVAAAVQVATQSIDFQTNFFISNASTALVPAPNSTDAFQLNALALVLLLTVAAVGSLARADRVLHGGRPAQMVSLLVGFLLIFNSGVALSRLDFSLWANQKASLHQVAKHDN